MGPQLRRHDMRGVGVPTATHRITTVSPRVTVMGVFGRTVTFGEAVEQAEGRLIYNRLHH